MTGLPRRPNNFSVNQHVEVHQHHVLCLPLARHEQQLLQPLHLWNLQWKVQTRIPDEADMQRLWSSDKSQRVHRNAWDSSNYVQVGVGHQNENYFWQKQNEVNASLLHFSARTQRNSSNRSAYVRNQNSSSDSHHHVFHDWNHSLIDILCTSRVWRCLN